MSADSLEDSFEIDLSLNSNKKRKRDANGEEKKSKIKKNNEMSILADLISETNKSTALDELQDVSLPSDATFGDLASSLIESSSSKKLKPGHPKLLIACGSAKRCVDVVRLMKSNYLSVAKLFSKHIKMEEQVKFCKMKRFQIAVGTPNRLVKLIQESALNISQVGHLIFDLHYKDKKNFSMLELKDVQNDSKVLLASLDDKSKVIGF